MSAREDPEFDVLVAEAEAAPVAGWDFSWLDGRVTEERPVWGYSRMVAARLAGVDALLDVQTGGGEMLGERRQAARADRRDQAGRPTSRSLRAGLASWARVLSRPTIRCCRSAPTGSTW